MQLLSIDISYSYFYYLILIFMDRSFCTKYSSKHKNKYNILKCEESSLYRFTLTISQSMFGFTWFDLNSERVQVMSALAVDASNAPQLIASTLGPSCRVFNRKMYGSDSWHDMQSLLHFNTAFMLCDLLTLEFDPLTFKLVVITWDITCDCPLATVYCATGSVMQWLDMRNKIISK